jgi:alpha-glucosidase
MFSRPGGFACVVNVSGEPSPLPPHTALLLAGDRLDDGPPPPGTAAWLAVPA